jgi:hypothetical protein
MRTSNIRDTYARLEGSSPVAKKVWRKPEVKSIVAGSAETSGKSGLDGGKVS